MKVSINLKNELGRSMLKTLDAAGYCHMYLKQWFTNGMRGLKMKGLIFLIKKEKEGHKKVETV